MNGFAGDVLNGLLDLLYPPCCAVCGAEMNEGCLCDVCRKSFRATSPPFCDRCGAPVHTTEIVCEECARGPEPPFAWRHAMAAYDGALRDAIHLLKYHDRPQLAAPLGAMLADSLISRPSPVVPAGAGVRAGIDLVVPVPLHPRRERLRGYNQSERIARSLSERLKLNVDGRALRRIKDTPTQTERGREERARNMRGAFEVRNESAVRGKSILLIDDVITTSATLREASQALMESGAKRVCVAAVAQD